jgi:RNase P/RNase MRP subunit p29
VKKSGAKIPQEEDKKEEEEGDEGEVVVEDKGEIKGNTKRSRYIIPKVSVPHSCRVCDGPLIIGGPIWN